ncbi:MAG: GHMP kinase, partial [Planctomycetota bacterium]|nr:GHMP kinase [Planctomycetota bacterium]
MELIRTRAYARAGLIGNPSDGYYGRTLSLIVRNYWAEVVLYEWEDLE